MYPVFSLASNRFVIGKDSFELCGSQVQEKVNNDIDCASNGSRQEQKANGLPVSNPHVLSFRLLLFASRKARRSSPASRSLIHCS